MIHRHKEAWRNFIQGRIAQEQGHEEEGLRAFERALEVEPDNEHFRESMEDARRNLSRNLSEPEEDLLTRIQKRYQQLAPNLTSEKHDRVDGLNDLLAELEGRPRHGHPRAYRGGLHC